VMRFVMLFGPMRFFFVPGLLTFLGGIGYGLARAVLSGRGFPVAASLFTMTGLVMAMLGLVADQISQLRFAQLSLESTLRTDVFRDPDVFEVPVAGAPQLAPGGASAGGDGDAPAKEPAVVEADEA